MSLQTCLDIKFCFSYSFFNTLEERNYGKLPKDDEELLQSIQAKLKTLGIDHAACLSEGNIPVISFVTSLMARAHSMKYVQIAHFNKGSTDYTYHIMMVIHKNLFRASGEIVFLDSSGGMDRNNVRLFLLVTHSSGGGIPLGKTV